VSACFVPVAVRCEGDREIDAEGGLGADKGWVEVVEGVGEDRSGVGVAGSGECVAAPAGEVHGVERDIGPLVD
jgi:hypothetical protein